VKDGAKFVVVILLLLSVITIFISPAVDLQPTALRALKLATMLLAFLALAATGVSTHLQVVLRRGTTTAECGCVWVPVPNLVDLNCTRRC
jgi:hypothetical protein